MKEYGVVLELIGDKAVVNVKRQSACGQCKACDLGTSEQKEINITAKNDLGAKVNDKVNLLIETPDLLKAVIIVYLIPLVALLAGVGISTYVTKLMGIDGETISIIVGLACTALSYMIVKNKDAKLKKTKKYEPAIVEILGQSII
ncbi:MAG: SoxR reducing system RseC family protein [Proteocatella sp.]